MSAHPQSPLERLISKHRIDHNDVELVIGSLRYEALRKLNPHQFTELHKRNLSGERFDDMVDKLVLNHEASPFRLF